MKRIFVYWRNISEHAQSVRVKSLAEIRYLDELLCAPGGHLPVVNGRFTLRSGQIVRMPIEFSMRGHLHKRPYLVHATYEDFEAAQNMKFEELAQEIADKAAAEAEGPADAETPWTHTYKGVVGRVAREETHETRGPVVVIDCRDGPSRTLNRKTWNEHGVPIEGYSAGSTD